jgi:hypothetical protein
MKPFYDATTLFWARLLQAIGVVAELMLVDA